jgi:3-hydroxyisobutyrate dehydrogenase-like beta-hydroxyacid dehydrogenase
VVDTSTVGVAAARAIDVLLAEVGVAYVDAPVSGGVAGARARTLVVMYAAPEVVCEAVEPVLAGLSDRRRQVGVQAGMAQALKLANNFLSAVALAATSEAVAFGRSVGLDMATMLDVLNASSGQSAATRDKFPEHVLTGRYAAGFTNDLMAKDLRLYLHAVEAEHRPRSPRPHHRRAVGPVRRDRARRRLHSHLPLRRGRLTAGVVPWRCTAGSQGWSRSSWL